MSKEKILQQKEQNKNGITLIALIITIIVLLILAGVTISILTGDNGIITKADEVQKTQIESLVVEEIKLSIQTIKLEIESNEAEEYTKTKIKSRIEEILNTESVNGLANQNEKGEYRVSYTDDFIIITYIGEDYKKACNYQEAEIKARIYVKENTFDVKSIVGYERRINEEDAKIKVIEGTGELLPEEYQQVEYIETTGKQYIDINYKPTINTDISCESFIPFSDSNYKAIYWTRSYTNSTYNTFGFIINNTDTIRVYKLSEGNSNITIGLRKKIENNIVYETKGNVFYINGEEYNLAKNISDSLDYSIFLFRLNENGQEFNSSTVYASGIKLYYFKVYENNKIVRNLIPCYRKKDGEIGLYDLVEGQFYINQGSGKFLKGENKNIY